MSLSLQHGLHQLLMQGRLYILGAHFYAVERQRRWVALAAPIPPPKHGRQRELRAYEAPNTDAADRGVADARNAADRLLHAGATDIIIGAAIAATVKNTRC